ncbi:MAG: AAA family ATPase, partial [Phycisphaerales bacterium]|nr:AAA family ATPase [Phycisphaerales bacterium]
MDNGSSKPSRIGRLVLENWRNFRQVDAQLQRRTFLVGPNASGKSNLLDALRFLRHLVRVGGGFQDALASRGGVSRLRCLAARRHPDIRIHVGILGDDGTEAWTYELAFGQDNLRRGKIQRERITRHGTVILDRPDSDDQADPERLTQTRIEQVQANQEFREIAAFFGSIQYRHLVPQLVREPDRSVGRRDDPFGGDFLEQIAATSSKTRDSRLRRIGQALRIAVPQLKELELTRDSRGVPHLRGKYEHWRPKGSWQFEEDFSDGTLRLLGLLWSILDRSGPLLLEEPELSLHSGIVRLLPQLFARVQK